MTLDEEIKKHEELAEENEENAKIWHRQTKNRVAVYCDRVIQEENDCIERAKEHRKMAEWLKELKQLRTAWNEIKEDPDIEEAIKMLDAKRECLKREISDTDTECINNNCENCMLNYAQGNMGEQVKALDIAIRALKRIDKIP